MTLSTPHPDRKDPTDTEVSVAEEGLQRIRDDLIKRRQDLERLQEEPQVSFTFFLCQNSLSISLFSID